ncbi:MAG: carbon storage regulator [Planctomycetota bacterium]
MPLVLQRKPGESVECTHGGEKMIVTVLRETAGRVKMSFDGPSTFRVMRSEALDRDLTAATGVEENLPCFFPTDAKGRFRYGHVRSVETIGDQSFYEVEAECGEVIKRVSAKDVTVLEKQTDAGFGEESSRFGATG